MTQPVPVEVVDRPIEVPLGVLPTPHAVEVRAVSKRFGTTQSLCQVDLVVEAGEVAALVGRNGAGKSTLIRILATAVLPDDGSVRVAGWDVESDGLGARRHLGLTLGDERSFFWRLSGRKNLDFFARLHGFAGEAVHQRVDEVLGAVALHDVADRRVDRYSTGMRSRLGIARALLGNPSVLLLDEPTRSLDPASADDVRRLVRELAGEAGTCVVLATHDLEEAAALADQVVVLASGAVVASRRTPVNVGDLRACIEDHR